MILSDRTQTCTDGRLFRSTAFRAARLVAALAIALFYVWCTNATSDRFVWDSDLDGYYDLLGRAFAGGHLYLPIPPSPELLALADPWDPASNQESRLLDAVLYKEHYYLYHGAAPALLLFSPWRLFTGHDLPERLAVVLLCFFGYLFSCGLLVEMLSALSLAPPLWLFTLFLIALGLDQSVPFLLQRVKVYEVAIAAGYFCVSAGFYFLAKTLTDKRKAALWAGLSGLSLAIAIGCRPHLGLAAACAFFLLLFRRPRTLLVFSLPVAAGVLALAGYNYARFGNPLEFGLRYQLGDSVYLNLRLSGTNILPGLYYLLACTPDFSSVFPFFRLAIRQPMALPARYFVEPIAGILSVCPLVLMAFAMPLLRRSVDGLAWALYLFSVTCILFISATGLSSQRFEVDFLPFLLLAACVLIAGLLARLRAIARRLVTIMIATAIFYSTAANVALAIQGPYDQLLQEKPDLYLNIARWFSPVARFRLLHNPRVKIAALFSFPAGQHLRPEPLFSLGQFGSRYALFAEWSAKDRVRLISVTAPRSVNERSVSIPLSGVNRVTLEFTPETRTMTVNWNGDTVLRHPLEFLITAPSQIRVGEESTFANPQRFSGRVYVIETSIQP
jgi:hypothetical protein